jgi:hypothetical protein
MIHSSARSRFFLLTIAISTQVKNNVYFLSENAVMSSKRWPMAIIPLPWYSRKEETAMKGQP